LIVTVCEFVSRSSAHCKASDSQFETLMERQARNQIQDLVDLRLSQADTDIDLQPAITAATWTIYSLALQ
jgi:hypothetical protein